REERGGGALGVIGRVPTATGAAGFGALLFVIVIPSLRQQATEPSTAEVIDSMKSAITRSDQMAKVREAQPAQEFQPIAASSEGTPAVSHEESEALLKQFMQWQNKPVEGQEKH